jgi:hypothetical protein
MKNNKECFQYYIEWRSKKYSEINFKKRCLTFKLPEIEADYQGLRSWLSFSYLASFNLHHISVPVAKE